VLIAVAVAIGTVTVMHLRAIFGSNTLVVTPKSSESAESFKPKVVTYEVSGSSATAVINYLDLEYNPRRVENAALPWSLTLRTTVPAATPSIVAQGDGQTISYLITVDGKVKDQRTATGVNAGTFCLVKSAVRPQREGASALHPDGGDDDRASRV
jgi:hypothetical protein